MLEPDQKPIFESVSPARPEGDVSPADKLADVEARLRAVERAEAELERREREFAEMSATMAHELREHAEAIKAKERETTQRAVMPEHLQRRRARLARVRRALRDRYLRFERAEAVLEERAREADQVLAHRRELSKLAADLEKREKRVIAKQSRYKIVSMMFYMIASLGVISVLSWAIADQIAPARYAVTAELVADGRGRTLSPDELDEWQRYHTSILTNPSLMELASDRMGKRGIEALARPGDLAATIKANLSSSSPEPGRLVLELRGDGAGLTRRSLDTYVVSIVSLANGTKDQRAGGAGTKVGFDAKVDPDPLTDDRLEYAGMIAGGISVVFGFGGFLAYRRLRAQHAAYEQGLIGA
ncbi:MAG TPA: hypothetical protein ENJ00_04370 [Phycisphaerales bacterium]|nr:hypothetical protein [Phycisphaerales bacterium]